MSRNRPRVLRQQMRYKAWTRARSKDMMAPPTAVAVGCLMKVTVCRPTMRRATPIPETVAVAACAPSRNRGNSRSRVPQCGGAPMASLFHTNFAHRHLRISVRTASTSNMLNMSSASRAGGEWCNKGPLCHDCRLGPDGRPPSCINCVKRLPGWRRVGILSADMGKMREVASKWAYYSAHAVSAVAANHE